MVKKEEQELVDFLSEWTQEVGVSWKDFQADVKKLGRQSQGKYLPEEKDRIQKIRRGLMNDTPKKQVAAYRKGEIESDELGDEARDQLEHM